MTLQEIRDMPNVEVSLISEYIDGKYNSLDIHKPYGIPIRNRNINYFRNVKIYKVFGEMNCILIHTNINNLDYYSMLEIDKLV